ncbi:MAG: cobalt-precorrin-5B (C(1))-methyltransferase [Desulfovibrio sp.]|nr:cobalt-precorrin-5B (C(1))-methyltransferase [Desulfovibrio sp.]
MDRGGKAGGTRSLAPKPQGWEPWDGSPLPESGELRWGFTTGACLTALACAGFRALQDRESQPFIDILFGDGAVRRIPLEMPQAGSPSARPGFLAVRKNAGDDPDCTHGALLYARLREAGGASLQAPFPPDPRDVLVQVGQALVAVHAVEGIGVATRAGLDCEQGRWAVNFSVQRMLASNLALMGMRQGRWVLEAGVENGAELARHTLNPALGIVGGISVLGSTGLVQPFSHESYIASIQLQVRCAKEAGATCMAFCTGGKTKRAAEAWCAEMPPGPLPPEAFCCMADFAGESLRAAQAQGMAHVLVCCMPGKLVKYAAGFDNTHAAKNPMPLQLLAGLVAQLAPERTELADRFAGIPTVREALGIVPEALKEGLLEELMRLALKGLASLFIQGAKRPRLILLAADFAGTPLALREEAEPEGPGKTPRPQRRRRQDACPPGGFPTPGRGRRQAP